MNTVARIATVVTCAALGASSGQADDPPTRRLAIKAGSAWTGETWLTGGVVVLCEGERITAIGRDLPIPPGTPVLDGGDGVLLPGLVDAGGAPLWSGGSEEVTEEVTPTLDATLAFDPDHTLLRRLRHTGVTSVGFGPGDGNVVGGLGGTVRTVSRAGGAWSVPGTPWLKFALGPAPEAGNYPPRRAPPGLYGRRPTTRMGTAWILRDALDRARRDPQAAAPLREAVAGTLTVRATAHRETDLRTALELATEFKLRLVIEGAAEAHRCLPDLVRTRTAVILMPFGIPALERGRAEQAEIRLDTAARLAAAGVPFALSAMQLEDTSLLEAAANAVRGGLARDAALTAITSGAAAILGAGGTIGSLAEGRAADLCLCSGDPLAPTTRVRAVVIGGEVAFGPE